MAAYHYLYVSGTRGPSLDNFHLNHNVYIDYEFDKKDWVTFNSKIILGKTVKPCSDIQSHGSVYRILRLCHTFHISYLESFAGWTTYPEWVNMIAPEYLYLINEIDSRLVDYRKFMLESTKPFHHVKKLLKLEDVCKDVTKRLAIIDFYTNLDIKQLVIGPEGAFNDSMRFTIRSLKKSRKMIYHKLVINLYDPAIVPIMTYSPSNDIVWSAATMGYKRNLNPGDDIIVPYDDFNKRFLAMTCGLIAKSPNPEFATNKFPWANVVITGGSVPAMLMPEDTTAVSLTSDIDLFIFGHSNEVRLKTYEYLLKWFHTSNTYFATEGSSGAIKTIYITDVPRKFQIINTLSSSGFEVVKGFDMSHVQWYITEHLGNLVVYGTIGAVKSMRSRVSEFDNAKNLKSIRIVKAMTRGFDIKYDKFINDNKLDIDVLLSDKVGLAKLMQDLYTWYYPISNLSIPPDIYEHHIKAQITVNSKATDVTKDINEALRSAAAGGAFTCVYDAPHFTTFNSDCVIHKGVVGWRHTYDMNDRNGKIRLSSTVLDVLSATTDDDGATIVLKADDHLKRFVGIMEVNVYPRFCNRPITRRLLTDDHLTLKITRERIDRQLNSKYALLRDRLGNSKHIDEDLYAGDKLSFTFTMRINTADTRGVDLFVESIIKENIDSSPPLYEKNDDIATNVAAHQVNDILLTYNNLGDD